MASSSRETKPNGFHAPEVMCFGAAAAEEVVMS